MQIDISQLTDYTARFTSVFSPQQQTQILAQVGKRVGAAAVRYAAEYPEPSGKKLPKIYQRVGKNGKTFMSKFKTQKQQGYVFALIAAGKVPYRRTGTLGKSITFSLASVSSSSVITEVGTNVPYAKRVIGEGDEQSNYHKGTWMTLPQRMNQNANKLRDVAVLSYKAEIDKRLT